MSATASESSWLARLLAPLLIGLAAAGASWLPAWQDLEWGLFDAWMRNTVPGGSSLPITVVGIDEASFAELGLQWPWPRSVHAELIEQLARAGAAVVVFDVLFAEASNPEDDAALARAISESGAVVLAADRIYQETAYARQWLRIDPLPLLREAGATSGLASIELDRDGRVRRLPVGADMLWRAIVDKLQQRLPGVVEPVEPPAGALIRFYGPDHSYPYLSYYQALQADTLLPAGALADQIVLIGRDVNASFEVGAAQADAFATPFTPASRRLTPGVELHATVLENVLSGQFIVPWPPFYAAALALAASGLAALLMRRWQPWRSAALAAVLSLTCLGASLAAFVQAQRWLPALAAALAPLLIYLYNGARAYLAERQARQTLRHAFSHYVSPEVMALMLAHPERLRLGGERRMLTLLFADLAGFTRLSETLQPEEVAQLINRYMSALADAVRRERGTVDKFIGDALMAFWNAPLDEPGHAAQALRAALAMLDAVEGLALELQAEGIAAPRLRIGVHSGEAVVGNMGSRERFDYTALGDAVNLASRLEGANKAFGTALLLSADTVAAIDQASRAGFGLRPVARVRVAGRSQPVLLYTAGAAAELIAATEPALEAWWRGDWAAARQAWQAVQALAPDDPLAAHYLAWIGGQTAAPEGWDGCLQLEK